MNKGKVLRANDRPNFAIAHFALFLLHSREGGLPLIYLPIPDAIFGTHVSQPARMCSTSALTYEFLFVVIAACATGSPSE